MTLSIPFSKYSGCGNDFILIDNRKSVFPKNAVTKLCKRRTGIGADGIILLENSHHVDFKSKIYNPDESEAEMCGNGMRCLGKFINEIGIKGNEFLIETKHKDIPIKITDPLVTVGMGNPTAAKWEMEVPIDQDSYSVSFLDTGVPHAVLFVPNINSLDLSTLGPKFRHHPLFQPKGTNFNLATVENGKISLRTYERGVEQETLACGTGATAAALSAAVKYQIPSPVTVHTSSGDPLEIFFEGSSKNPRNVKMSGPASLIYRGVFAI